MALDSTVGGSTADSYADDTFIDAYMANHPYQTGWTNAATHEAELKYAVIILDNWVEWGGVKDDITALTQALEFPRDLSWDVDDLYSTVIPIQIKRAQVELALHLVQNTEIYDPQALKDIDLGKLEMTFNTTVFVLPSVVTALISKFGVLKPGLGSGMGNATLVRV